MDKGSTEKGEKEMNQPTAKQIRVQRTIDQANRIQARMDEMKLDDELQKMIDQQTQEGIERASGLS